MTRVQREKEGGSAKSGKLKEAIRGKGEAFEPLGFACLMTRVQGLEPNHIPTKVQAPLHQISVNWGCGSYSSKIHLFIHAFTGIRTRDLPLR